MKTYELRFIKADTTGDTMIIGEASTNLEQIRSLKSYMEKNQIVPGIFRIIDESGNVVTSDKGSDYVEGMFLRGK